MIVGFTPPPLLRAYEHVCVREREREREKVIVRAQTYNLNPLWYVVIGLSASVHIAGC